MQPTLMQPQAEGTPTRTLARMSAMGMIGMIGMGWVIPLGILALAVVFDLVWLAAGVWVAAWFRRGCP
jgi:hypothetical protein